MEQNVDLSSSVEIAKTSSYVVANELLAHGYKWRFIINRSEESKRSDGQTYLRKWSEFVLSRSADVEKYDPPRRTPYQQSRD